MKTAKLTVLLLAAGLVGTTAAQSYKGPKVALTYLHGFTGADRPVMEKLIAQFNATHPNIQVKAQAQPWGTTWQQLPSLVASGRAPDVVVINEDQITNFIARGAVSPLTDAELKASGISKARFYGPLFKTADYEGKSYGVPISSVAYVMFYNKELMKKAGVTKVPTTRAEFLAAAQACTTDKSGKKAGQAGFDPKNLDTWGVSLYNNWVGARMAYAAILQNGGSLVDKQLNANFNSPQAVEAVQFLVDLVQKHGVARPNSTEEAELAAFSQGKVCFFPSGQWYLDRFEQQKMDFGVAFVPRIGSKQDAAWGGSSHLTLPKQRAGYDANKRLAALEFVNWMTQPAQNLSWTEAGSLPVMPAVARDKKFEGRPISGVFAKLSGIYATSGFPWGGQVLGPFDNAWANAYSGKMSVKQALDGGVSEANKQIEQARKTFQ
ncbi:ABC transporter substrate-binding protein (plasmid) [Deinococcus taeanensis]|uniref:ABC transporter substrate-binding protein n=1 Tax=Deinococcus taeanensis TaxID=2737050 RepID=UPI001CDBD9B4|nr:ABC transporter substrate-binding protein [Deinococcus taeanensis]UBV44223.1 ABC transporter substrate-binding protein [Deinococcus taeanensis]